MFFSFPTWAVALVVFANIGTATAIGYGTGRYLRNQQETLREPFGVVQAAQAFHIEHDDLAQLRQPVAHFQRLVQLLVVFDKQQGLHCHSNSDPWLSR